MNTNLSLSNKKIEFSGLFSFCLFLLIWPMFVGPLIAILNPSFFDGPEAIKMSFSSGLYSARNIAIGLAFLGAIFFRNAPILFALIFIRLVTDIIDAPLYYLHKDPVLFGLIVIFTLQCYLPAIYGLRYLWKQIKIKTD